MVNGTYGLDKRPAFLEAISQLSKGDVLLVAKRDRLGREEEYLERVGSVPYGYPLADDNKLEPDQDEQIVIAEVKAIHQAGLGLRAIARK